MGDIAVLPGVERRDLGQPVPSADVLRYAIEAGITDVVVMGRSRDGQPYFASEDPNADTVVGKLMRGVDFLVRSEVVHLDEEEESER